MKILKSQITIDGLFEAISRMTDSCKEAALIMVALVDKDAGIYKQIQTLRPEMPLQLLVNLEKVGRGTMHEMLLWDTSPAARRLITLPYSQQKEYCEKPIPVVTEQAGKKVVIQKPIQQCTSKEINVAIGPAGLRDTSEQSKEIDRMKAQSRTAPAPAQRYELRDDGTLVINLAPTTFTPAQLQDIYERAVAKAVKALEK